MIDMSDDAVRKRRVFLDLNEEAFMMWRHDHVTEAFLQLIADQIATGRELAADLIEWGVYEKGAQEENRNPDVLRGKITAWRDLHKLTLADIHRAYGEAAPFEENLGQPFREDDE